MTDIALVLHLDSLAPTIWPRHDGNARMPMTPMFTPRLCDDRRSGCAGLDLDRQSQPPLSGATWRSRNRLNVRTIVPKRLTHEPLVEREPYHAMLESSQRPTDSTYEKRAEAWFTDH
jgi:hypothetical protein